MKKFFLMAMILITLIFSSATAVCAEEGEEDTESGPRPITAKILNASEDTLYHKFDSPIDIFFAEDKLYIASKSGCDVYGEDGLSTIESNATDFAYAGKLITLSGGNIKTDGLTLEGNYTAISAYGETLYALEGNTVYKFTVGPDTISEKSVYHSSEFPVGAIAATNDGCAYSVLVDTGYCEIYEGEKLYASLPGETVLDLCYDQYIYALTQSRLVKYIEKRRPIEYSVIGKKIAVGDKVYILTSMGNVRTISLDLNESTARDVIASASDSDWFYYSPQNVGSMLGKIYVTDRDLNRVAVIAGNKISYFDKELVQPAAVAADNIGNVYIAHDGNKVAKFSGEEYPSEEYSFEEDIIDIQIDYNNNVYCLTESGKILDAEGKVLRSDVKAFTFQNGFHYLTSDGYADDTLVGDVRDFCIDIAGNIFTVSGNNTITAYVNGLKTEYTVNNAAHIASIAMCKADNESVLYGDLILVDDTAKCVLKVNGSDVGSVNVKTQYAPPSVTDQPAERSEGLIAKSTCVTYIFSLPIEGEIAYVLSSGEHVIVCNGVSAPDNIVYCLCDNAQDDSLIGGYVYKANLEFLPYEKHSVSEAKINAVAPIYKYPTIKAPYIATYEKNTVISILPFAVNSRDSYEEGWYTDVYSNKWYRIEFGDKEGYVISDDINPNFFSDLELPKTNATITENTQLYRKDEASGEYIPFEAEELSKITKDTRVVVDTPFDTSRQYTKVAFYREGYGTVDIDCYVRTEFVKYDGVDIIKIIAITVIIVAVITLILVLIRRRKTATRSKPSQPHDPPVEIG